MSSAAPLTVKLRRDESITVGYGAPPYVNVILDPRGAESADEFGDVADFFHSWNGETTMVVHGAATRIVLNGMALPMTPKSYPYSPGSVVSFGNEPYGTSIVLKPPGSPDTPSSRRTVDGNEPVQCSTICVDGESPRTRSSCGTCPLTFSTGIPDRPPLEDDSECGHLERLHCSASG